MRLAAELNVSEGNAEVGTYGHGNGSDWDHHRFASWPDVRGGRRVQ